MKSAFCDICGEKFKVSTSRLMKKGQTEHWNKTGHRRFIGVVGFGNHTFDPHPKFPDVSQERQRGWVPEETMSKEEEMVEGITEEELEAMLAGYATKKDLVGAKKDLVTHEELKRSADALQHTIRGVEQAIQAGAYGGGQDAGLRKEVEAALTGAKKQMDSINQRIDGLKEVTDRFKSLEKKGIASPEDVVGIRSRVQEIHDAVANNKEEMEKWREHIVNDHCRDIESLFARVEALEKGKPVEEVLLPGKKVEKKRGEESLGAAILEQGDTGKVIAMAPSDKEQRAFRIWLCFENEKFNADECADYGALNFNLTKDYCKAVVTVGLMEGWLKQVDRKMQKGPGRPKKIVTGVMK